MFYPQIQATAGGGSVTNGGTVLATRTAEIFGLADRLRTPNVNLRHQRPSALPGLPDGG
ncbi:hypothetical protein MUG78_05195 [Gordonia alkaliphila]|uniref:hypothetical protein n=1 Tax=Gordonia alkaliphila TaxID=1053547 RepID=UPI001FF47F15|nr:hypothetical protein [Gordonia alkaliphila]MCK0438876.1 hypothetical protein [Gordonia alkaliphila]